MVLRIAEPRPSNNQTLAQVIHRHGLLGQAQGDVGAFRVHGDRLQLDGNVLRDAEVHAPGIGQGTHLQSQQLGAGGIGELNDSVKHARESSSYDQVKGGLACGQAATRCGWCGKHHAPVTS